MSILVKGFKAFGFLLLLAALVAVFTGVALWLEWPPLTGVVVVAGLYGLIFFVRSLKKLFMWRNKKRFVAHIMTQDNLTRSTADLASLRPIRQVWEHGMAHLRRSPLRQHKNPVYALPWFLMLGERDSGKSTLLAQTGGVRPLGESLAPTATAQEKDTSLAWMFLPDAVILEANPRYAGSLDASADSRDWEEFLTLLAAERTREPLNGALLTISAERLLHGSGVEMSDMANNLRNRLMQITVMLGSRFPVYVVVTQLDTLPGMPGLLARLPEQHREQTLGSCASPTAPLPMEQFVCQSLAQAEQQLHFALAELAEHDKPPRGGDLRALAELRSLKGNLVLFMDVLFRPNPHQPSLMPRGLFLTSVLVVDDQRASDQLLTFMSASEHIAPERIAPVGIIPETVDAQAPKPVHAFSGSQLPAVHSGMGRIIPCFLGELFFRILPGDRNLHQPLEGFWAMKTRIVGTVFTAWYLATFCLCGLFALNTLYNWHVLHTANIVDSTADNPLAIHTYALYTQNNQIRKIHHSQAVWWLPTFGLNRLDELEQLWIKDFEKNFLTTELMPFLQETENSIRKPDKRNGEKQRFQMLQQLMWMSKALELRRKDGVADATLKLPFPSPVWDEGKNSDRDSIWNPAFGNFFAVFLNRANDSTLERLGSELEKTTLLTLGPRGVQNFAWLIDAINESPQLTRLYLEIFVPHRTVPTENSTSIPPAYTSAGYSEIALFMDGLLTATRHNAEIAKPVEQFWKRYHKDYAEAWNTFGFKANSIWNDEFRLDTLNDLFMASSIRDTPQVQLLAHMGRELEPLTQAKVAPKWVANVILVNAMLELTSQRWEAHPGTGETSSLSMLFSSLLSNENPIWPLLSSDLLNLTELRTFFNAAAGLYAYYGNADRLSKTMASPEAAFQLVQAHYGGAQYGKIDESPYTLATESLKSALDKLPKVDSNKDVARFVLASQLQFMAHALIVRSADVLDTMWVSSVVAPGQLVQHNDAKQEELAALFGEKGLATAFVEKQAQAFLTRDRGGYHPALWQGQPFPFTEDFLSYIQDGQVGAASPPKDSYVVTLRSDPTSVNINAVEKPQSTLFSLTCTGGPVSLQNDNYPKQLNVTYKPKECGAAALSIRFPSLTLNVAYPDFPAFLADFLYGERVFTAQDFPEQAEALASIGVREIMVRLLPDNATPVLAGQHASVPVMPERITFSR